MKATVTRGKRHDCGILSPGAARKVASGIEGMTSRSESVRNVIRVNATSIDVTSSNTIAFGYVNELARAGRVIGGRHRLHCPLGKKPISACGGLWRADSLSVGRSVMVELLDPAIAEDPSLTDLFVEEARAAAAVTSPFVSRVLDFGVEASTPYLVTEIGVGHTLADRIATQQRPSHAELARIVGELGQALDEMHSVDVLHRDLRSDRVQLVNAPSSVDPQRVISKLSFGISKLMNDTLELVRTMAHRALGPSESPQYSSPEQVLGTAPLSPQSDLWALAVIAFECMTGELPFVGATMGERLVQICTGSARVPSEICEVPSGFDDWFARGVRKAAVERWASAHEMADALAAVLAPGR
jgi:serine/threonine protein kinase